MNDISDNKINNTKITGNFKIIRFSSIMGEAVFFNGQKITPFFDKIYINKDELQKCKNLNHFKRMIFYIRKVNKFYFYKEDGFKNNEKLIGVFDDITGDNFLQRKTNIVIVEKNNKIFLYNPYEEKKVSNKFDDIWNEGIVLDSKYEWFVGFIKTKGYAIFDIKGARLCDFEKDFFKIYKEIENLKKEEI